ncbi:uncharacterized protein [Atheta coriaria]|uniref:uncharacterized protein isoform X2 n=2 Tax=Dalotia coriaria TaxID=877792 RepID=UPI0031F375D9
MVEGKTAQETVKVVDIEVQAPVTNKVQADEVTENKMPAATTLQTAPFDPRFPNTNQTRYCYQSYLDFHRCQKVKGESYSPCQYFKKVYGSICPNGWVEKWDGQRDEGTFPGNI